jgi:hypothetical protein
MALELVAELLRPCVDEVAIESVVAVHPETRSVCALQALAQNDVCRASAAAPATEAAL